QQSSSRSEHCILLLLAARYHDLIASVAFGSQQRGVGTSYDAVQRFMRMQHGDSDTDRSANHDVGRAAPAAWRQRNTVRSVHCSRRVDAPCLLARLFPWLAWTVAMAGAAIKQQLAAMTANRRPVGEAMAQSPRKNVSTDCVPRSPCRDS